MIKIRYAGASAEAEACRAFLYWQGWDCVAIEDMSVLRQTRGRFGVVTDLNPNPDTNPVGFTGLYEHFQKHGMMRLA